MTNPDTVWYLAAGIAKDLHRGLDKLAALTQDPEDHEAIETLKRWAEGCADVVKHP